MMSLPWRSWWPSVPSSECQNLKVWLRWQDAGFQQAFDPILVKYKPTAEESGTGELFGSGAVDLSSSLLQ